MKLGFFNIFFNSVLIRQCTVVTTKDSNLVILFMLKKKKKKKSAQQEAKWPLLSGDVSFRAQNVGEIISTQVSPISCLKESVKLFPVLLCKRFPACAVRVFSPSILFQIHYYQCKHLTPKSRETYGWCGKKGCLEC